METILTVTFSVLGTLAVVFIVGTVVGLRKVLKDNASLKDSITGLKNDIDDVHKRIDSEHRDIMDEMENGFRDVHEHKLKEMQESLDRLHDALSSKTGNVYSDMDRRFDKLYSKIYEKFPDLKSSYSSVKEAFDNLFQANGTTVEEENQQ